MSFIQNVASVGEVQTNAMPSSRPRSVDPHQAALPGRVVARDVDMELGSLREARRGRERTSRRRFRRLTRAREG